MSIDFTTHKRIVVTVQPLHLLVFIFMKTRSLVVPPYADLDEKVLMQTSLDKGTQRKTTENELPSLTQCTA